MRRTKLVCTIGPASQDRVDQLVAAGMDVARLNFSHGTDEDHQRAAAAVRTASGRHGRPVAILADLPGPKIRLGDLPGGELALATGDRFALGADASVTYAGLADDVRDGDRLMLADGAVELEVLDTRAGIVETEVVRGGTVRSGAGLNGPSGRLRLPAVTDRDREALRTILAMGVDYVAQSFVRHADDLRALRELMGRGAPIMAKIETRAAVENLAAILEEADALMLARGDLGVEIPFEDVPLIQKRVIDASVAAGVPVVVATQMLESMVSAARPTRAEANDVANAVLDGADAVMLSAETAIGAYPVESADAAVAICRAAEADPSLTHHPSHSDLPGTRSAAAAIAAAAVQLVQRNPDVGGIACFTRTGTTARMLARLRPGCPVTALSPDPAVVRRMALLRAISPVLSETPDDTEAMISLLDATLRTSAGLSTGTQVVLVASIPFGAATTNFLKLHRLGDA